MERFGKLKSGEHIVYYSKEDAKKMMAPRPMLLNKIVVVLNALFVIAMFGLAFLFREDALAGLFLAIGGIYILPLFMSVLFLLAGRHHEPVFQHIRGTGMQELLHAGTALRRGTYTLQPWETREGVSRELAKRQHACLSRIAEEHGVDIPRAMAEQELRWQLAEGRIDLGSWPTGPRVPEDVRTRLAPKKTDRV